MAKGVTVYDVVTDKICELLAKGTVPWRKPWTEKNLPQSVIRTNKGKFVTKEYRGINVWLLNALGFSSPYFLTWKKIEALGGKVVAGEEKKSSPVVYWKIWEKPDDTDPTNTDLIKKIWILRYYRVYNLEQTMGLDQYVPDLPSDSKPIEPIAECEKLVEGYKDKPSIRHNGSDAHYNRASDEVVLPSKESFTSTEGYYSTLFHELVHSTGHTNRLNRLTSDCYKGSHEYTLEELVAEMGASYLCAKASIDSLTLDNSASYIASWLSALRTNPKWVVQAGSKAQKAVKFMTEEEEQEPSFPTDEVN